MSLQQIEIANFGRSVVDLTGSSGVGYTLLDEFGATIAARTTTGVYTTAPGVYAVFVTFPNNFHGQILWDTGPDFSPTFYASKAYIETSNPQITEVLTIVTALQTRVDSLYQMQFGRWKIVNNQMIFYEDDNVTEIARFNLFDDVGAPTMDAVFDRRKV